MSTITPELPGQPGPEFTTPTSGRAPAARTRNRSGTAKPPVGSAGPDARTLKQLQVGAALARQKSATEDGTADTGESESAPAEPRPRDDVESIEVRLPDGREVLYAPPTDLSFRMSELLGPKVNDVYLQSMVRTIMGVRLLDGKQPRRVDKLNDVRQIAADLTDDGIDTLYLAHTLTWPPVTQASLQILKKNLRK